MIDTSNFKRIEFTTNMWDLGEGVKLFYDWSPAKSYNKKTYFKGSKAYFILFKDKSRVVINNEDLVKKYKEYTGKDLNLT